MAAFSPSSLFVVRIFTTVLLLLLLRVIPALASTDSILETELSRASNASLLWGPYRPNLYFGVKPRIPKSLIAGLMWSGVNDFQQVQKNFRHQCEQGDNMAGYGWEEYDVRHGGSQTIYDQGNNLDLTTSFVKVPGGDHGGSWGVRIKGVPREGAPEDVKTTLWFYVGLEGFGSVSLQNEPDAKGLQGNVLLDGSVPGLGEFSVEITKGPEENRPPMKANRKAWEEQPLDRTLYSAVQIPTEEVWRSKELLFQALSKNIREMQEKYTDEMPPPWQTFLLKNSYGMGNLHFVQKVFEGPFEFDVLYSSASAAESMTSDKLTEKIAEAKTFFQERFDRVFERQAPFDTAKYKPFAQQFLSNLLGGIGHFYGNSVVDRTYAEEYEEQDEGFWDDALDAQKREGAAQEEGPSELFTSIPSRPFFPRGFYWDEGFHLLPISDWDSDLTLEIVRSWFALIDDDGWIGREQILGNEARSKVPPEFQVQYPHYANPPTLFFILTKFIDSLESHHGSNTKADGIAAEDLPSFHLQNQEAAQAYLKRIYPALRKHYDWFRKTQRGDIRSWDREAFSQKEGYRWRGRTPEHCLTSGLDDYPRAVPPHTGELHVDLLSWVGMMTSCIQRIATTIGETDDAAEYARISTAVQRNIDDLHWSAEHKTYCDLSIDAYEESVHICHKGYISIFPFLVGLLSPSSPHLGDLLALIRDPDELWSPYGLRSLSKSDEQYGTGENYWKGPVWININYLAIKQLYEYGSTAGPWQKRAAGIYKELRQNVVENVFRQWEASNYAWEQYNPETGEGQRTAHFLGWTSLVVSVMSMPEEAVVGGSGARERVRDEL